MNALAEEQAGKPSGTAMGTALLRALAYREYGGEGRGGTGKQGAGDQGLGSDHLARYFIPGYLRHGLSTRFIRDKVKEKVPPGLYEFLTARTAWFDRVFVRALEEKAARIVLLGAGYDTRALRFSGINRGTRIIELDMPQTQGRKRECLHKAGIETPESLRFAAIDFHTQKLSEVLEAEGYDKSEPTLFLWEGVTYYLEREAVDATLSLIAENRHPQSRVAFDYAVPVPEGGLDGYGVREIISLMLERHPDEKTRFSLEDADMESFLAGKGLSVQERLDHRDMEKMLSAGGGMGGHCRIIPLFRLLKACPC
ncbi:MAG: SAM-dependent methyltransferase [Thermodesulfobacteriota bacterium]